jgi:hypothetical protein
MFNISTISTALTVFLAVIIGLDYRQCFISPHYTSTSEREVFNCVILCLQLLHRNKCLWAEYALMDVRYLFEDWCNSYNNNNNNNNNPFQFYAHWDLFLVISLRSWFWKNKSRLMRSACCLCTLPYQRLNGLINLYETVYVYHGTWAHLNGVLHKSLPSVCAIVARQGLGKTLPQQRIHTQQQNCWARRFLCGPFVSKYAIRSSQNFLFL